MTYIIGFSAIALGTILVIYTEWFVNNFGRSAWAEAKFGGDGGTRLLYKLIGLTMILLAFMGMTGMLGNIILAIFGNLFVGLQ
jgi:hypothetical protein